MAGLPACHCAPGDGQSGPIICSRERTDHVLPTPPPARLDLTEPPPYRPDMDGRRFVLMSPGGVLASAVAEAQQAGRVARVGFLQPGEAPARYMEAFRRGLRELGWLERQNLVIEHRIAPAIADNASVVSELISLKVDVLVTWTTPAVVAAKRGTDTIPIVAISGNPVAMGLVRSLAKPGGNVTGMAILTDELELKNLQILEEADSVDVARSRPLQWWEPSLGTCREAPKGCGADSGSQDSVAGSARAGRF